MSVYHPQTGTDGTRVSPTNGWVVRAELGELTTTVNAPLVGSCVTTTIQTMRSVAWDEQGWLRDQGKEHDVVCVAQMLGFTVELEPLVRTGAQGEDWLSGTHTPTHVLIVRSAQQNWTEAPQLQGVFKIPECLWEGALRYSDVAAYGWPW